LEGGVSAAWPLLARLWLVERSMNRLQTTTQGVMSAAFLAAGSAKLAGKMQEEFDRFGYPAGFRNLIGVVETTAATCLAAGLRPGPHEAATAAGSLLACGTMAGAVWSHLVRGGDPLWKALPAATLFAASGWTALHSLQKLAGRQSSIRKARVSSHRASARRQFASSPAG
jgi:hypothetical protein